MKGVDLFCASPSSTAICSNKDGRSMIRHGTTPPPPICRRISDRRKVQPPLPCASQLPVEPEPYYPNIRKGCLKKITSGLPRKSSADINDLTSNPPSSSRYLLSDTSFIDLLPDSDHAQALSPTKNLSPKLRIFHDSPSLKSPSTPARPRHQVVELRVSIHCKGCEAKVRKHISRMEGVTSFTIDLATKKVTVIGDMTPLGMLTSISTVKKAQFWSSPTS
ncbi:hypothetical protein U1Q18_033251 [Sarracenia purpurea var. burkii]